MTKACLLIVLAALLHINLKAQNSAAVSGKTYAIVIGISAYADPDIPKLNYADKDAKLFAAYLQSAAGGHLPDSQIRVLVNEGATVAAISDAIDWLKSECNKGDRAFFYFSGHGDLETKVQRSKGYLLAFNTPATNYVNHAIGLDVLNGMANFLSAIKSASTILITDACHSGKLAGDFIKGSQLVGESLHRALYNEVRLTACNTSQKAQESMNWGGGRGAFSYYLLGGMYGLAGNGQTGAVKLRQIDDFLSTSFRNDQYLKSKSLSQNPVIDGNAEFIVTTVNSEALQEYKASLNQNGASGLKGYEPAPMDTVDYFFSVIDSMGFEGYYDFAAVTDDSLPKLPLRMVDFCIAYKDSTLHEQRVRDSTNNQEMAEPDTTLFGDVTIMRALRRRLEGREATRKKFRQKFVEAVQNQAQDRITAYITGEEAELERRQYYYGGRKSYDRFLAMLNVAIKWVDPDAGLSRTLAINQAYLTGLAARLQMATASASASDSLLQVAFAAQNKTLELEPDAAYAHNELGNLFVRKKNFESAIAHFKAAISRAPQWSIPWANLARVQVASQQWDAAEASIRKADLLRPNLSFNLMIGGWVMEHRQNWLGAEERYLKAIALNKAHFFPYERVGLVYLKTGRFADADLYLYKASLLKEHFALNEDYFYYGPEEGGLHDFTAMQQYLESCWPKNDIAGHLKPFLQLAQALQRLQQTGEESDSGLIGLQAVLRDVPDMPLAQHYAGKKLAQMGRWKEAEAALLQAIANYKTEAELETQLHKLVPAITFTTDSCLLTLLDAFNYSPLEDHYLLASVYEKQNLYAKAIERYRQIVDIENKKIYDQARLVDYGTAETNCVQIKQGAVIKLARLQTAMGDLLGAEKTLLRQVLFTRQMARLRDSLQLIIPSGFGCVLEDINYGLKVCHDIEVETDNFYLKATTDSSRSAAWFEKAGMFLYNRMRTAYNRMPVSEYTEFTASFNKYVFPWTGRRKDEPMMDSVIVLPGTGETISIQGLQYHPVRQALAYLQTAVQLSPKEPSRKLNLAMADLNNWLGNCDAAASLMKVELQRKPSDSSLRNKLVETLETCNDLLEVKKQLLVLRKQKKLQHEQLLHAVQYAFLSNDFTSAKSLLASLRPADSTEQAEKIEYVTVISWLQNRPQDALKTLLNSFPKNSKPHGKGRPVADAGDFDFKSSFCPYAIARSYALMNQPEKALAYLKQALDGTFDYKYVLDFDEA
ncbi:MAG: hypothetical protein EOO10_05265, partial [Chitinophagaceae bacterium]